MSGSQVARNLLRLSLFVGVLLLVGSCGSGDTGTDPQPPTIVFSLNPTSAIVDQGGSVAVAGTATVGGTFTGPVAVTLEGWPLGLTGVVSGLTSNGTTTTVTVTLTVASNLAAGMYNLTIRAAGSGISVDATFALTVNLVQEYTLSVTPDTITLEQSTSGTRDVALVRTNFADDVTLTAEGAPSGLVVSFAPNPVTADASTATVAVGAAVAAGTYVVVIRGTTTALTDRVDTLSVTVVVPTGPAFLLVITPDTLRVNQGLNQGDPSNPLATIDITRLNGHTDLVGLLFQNANQVGISGSFVQVTGNTSDLSIGVNTGVPPGEYVTSVRGDDGTLAPRSIPLVLIVSAEPAYTITAAVDTLTLDQGTEASVVLQLARTNFAGNVDLTVEGLPGGVTAAFAPASTTGDVSAITVTVGSAVVVGDYTLTVRGTSTLSDVTDTFVLRVVEAVGFSLLSIPDLTVQQGGSGSRDVTITRTGGFTGDVTIVVEGLPTGITASVAPTPTTGATATITINVASNVAVQTYLPTIRGTASGQSDALTSMDINVTASAGSQVSMSFSACSVNDRPLWLALQDGGGAWTQVVGAGDVYDFTVSSATAGVAYATSAFGESTVSVQYLTQTQWGAGEFLVLCDDSTPLKTVTGTLANSVGSTNLNLGEARTNPFADGPFSIFGVAPGALDFVAYSAAFGGADRMLILRDQDIADNQSIGTIDFAAGVDAASASITIGGLVGGESLFGGMDYATVSAGSTCSVGRLVFGGLTSPFTAGGAPSGIQNADDFHVVNVSASLGTGIRLAREAFNTLADRTVSLGSVLPPTVPTDVTGGGNYLRLQAAFALPSDYDGFSSFFYNDAVPNTVAIFVSNGVQSGSVSLSMPDFSAVSGWTDAWVPTPNATSVTWGLTGSSQTSLEPFCTEGGRVINGVQAGVHN